MHLLAKMSRTVSLPALDTRRTRPFPERSELAVADARRIAEHAHRGQSGPDGRPYIHHVERVSKTVTSDARAVAWLHDVIERSDIDQATLTRAGASADQLLAVRLLTRDKTEQTDQAYLAYISAIIKAPGRSGEIARCVKHADLRDHLLRPAPQCTGWRPPFLQALALIDRNLA